MIAGEPSSGPPEEPKNPATLAAALVAAQSEMPAVKPDAYNSHFKSHHVSLGHLIAKVRPVLNKHGLAFTQYPSRAEDGMPTLVTILMHESGEQLASEAPLFLSKQDAQGQGSAITYLRRYALASTLGISDQEDDDGNGASGDKEKGKPKLVGETSNGVAIHDGDLEVGGEVTVEGARIAAAEERAAKIVKAIKEKGVSWDEQKLMLAATGIVAPEEKPATLAGAKAIYSALDDEQAAAALRFVQEAK